MWKRNLHCRLAAQRFKHQVWICPSTSSWSECFFLATALDNNEAPNVHLLMLYSFPNLGILHVTKKNVSKVLEERMIEAFRMGYNCGIYIHPEIDALQGEVRMPRELTGRRSVYFCLKFNQSNVISIQDNHPFFCWPSQDGSSDIFTCAYDIYSCLTTKKMMACSGMHYYWFPLFKPKIQVSS